MNNKLYGLMACIKKTVWTGFGAGPTNVKTVVAKNRKTTCPINNILSFDIISYTKVNRWTVAKGRRCWSDSSQDKKLLNWARRKTFYAIIKLLQCLYFKTLINYQVGLFKRSLKLNVWSAKVLNNKLPFFGQKAYWLSVDCCKFEITLHSYIKKKNIISLSPKMNYF